MSTTRSQTTLKLLQDKAGLTPEAGIKNIEGWETYLRDHDAPGVKAIVADLGKLKSLLGAKDLDGSKIKQLVVKLGKETAALGKKADGPNAAHLEELGAGLQNQAG